MNEKDQPNLNQAILLEFSTVALVQGCHLTLGLIGGQAFASVYTVEGLKKLRDACNLILSNYER